MASSHRLLWLTERYYPERGGMATSCERIVSALRSAGVEIDVAHFSRRAERMSTRQDEHGRDWAIPLGDDTAHAIQLLWTSLHHEDAARPYSHVVAFGGQAPLLAAPVFAAWLRCPLVTLLRGNDFDTGLFIPARRYILDDALRRSARVCSVSRDKAWKVTALHPGIEVTWIPNGIDLASWKLLPSEREGAATWRRSAIAPERYVLGLFGDLKPKKGVQFFLEALLASGRADRFHLLLIGQLSPELSAFLDHIREKLTFTHIPPLDRYQLLPRYAACDIIALPSLYDGLPNVLLEAASLGLPLLASAAGGAADLLIDGLHGRVFRPGDAAACISAIQYCAQASAAELNSWGEACHALVTEHLTVERETTAYLRVLDETSLEQAHAFRSPTRVALGD